MAISANLDFQRAIKADATIDFNYIQAGRVECLLGQHKKAVEALGIYTQKRPNNPLGNLELAFSYDHLLEQVDQIAEPNQTEQEKLLALQNKAWQSAGYSPKDLLSIAENYRRQGDFANAWEWFRRSQSWNAINQDPTTSALINSWSTITNPKFEIDSGVDFGIGDSSPNNQIPDGWVLFAHSGGVGADWVEFRLEPDLSMDKGQIIHIIPQRSNLDFVLASIPIVTESNSSYTAEVQARKLAKGLGVRMEIQYRNKSGESLGIISSKDVLELRNWETLSISGITPPATHWVVIRLRLHRVEETEGSAQFKSLRFEPTANE
jgi:hypothetical protein